MDIAIIGTGAVGSALGRGWSRAGHRIRYGTANPADRKHVSVASAAGQAQVETVSAAALNAEVIVLAVPWEAVPDVVKAIGPSAGKLVIDATNPLCAGANGLGLAVGHETSGGEMVAALLPESRVVKTMNQVGFSVMDSTQGYPTTPTMFVAGDDGDARAAAMELVADLGFAPLDAGPMRVARLLEPYAMLWIHMAVNQNSPPTGAFALMQLTEGVST